MQARAGRERRVRDGPEQLLASRTYEIAEVAASP